MTRLIDADAIPWFVEGVGEIPVITQEEIDDMPIIEAEPVRHGKWKQWDSYGFEDTYKCTACGESFVLIEGTPITNGYKYCPNCGAKMDEEGDNETD